MCTEALLTDLWRFAEKIRSLSLVPWFTEILSSPLGVFSEPRYYLEDDD